MSKIVFGTAKFGHFYPSYYRNSLFDTLRIALNLGLDIHVSPTYGQSLRVIRNKFFPLSKFESNIIIKVDATYVDYIEFQILLTKRMLGVVKPVEVQLTGNINPRHANLSPLFKVLDSLIERRIISYIYFTRCFLR